MMDDDIRPWSSLELEDFDTSGCSELQERQPSELQFNESQFEETEKKYSEMLSEVREMRKCLSPVEEIVGKPPADDVSMDMSVHSDQFSDDPYFEHALKRMRRLDVLLDLLTEKEKDARLNTSRLQIQVRKDIESECGSIITSEVFKRHTQKFLSLCPPSVEERKTEKKKQDVKSPFLLEVIEEEPTDIEEKEKANDSCPIKEERLKEQPNLNITLGGDGDKETDVTNKKTDADGSRKKTAQKFIERNKKLVSDSHKVGTPCMTEEERNHLDKLLKNLTCAEIEEIEKPQSSDNGDKSEGFVISVQKRRSLEGIDTKLEVLSAERDPEQDNDQFYLKEDDQERGWKELQMKTRLKEINQSLTAIAETALQQIEPIDEHQIKKLLRKNQGSSSTATTRLTSAKTDCSSYESCYSSQSCSTVPQKPLPPNHVNTPTSANLVVEDVQARLDSSQIGDIISSETLAKLVEEVKNQMPGFQYRHTKFFGSDEDENKLKSEVGNL